MAATSPTRLSVRDTLPIGDPLHELPEGQPVGLVVRDFATKRRIRINGTLVATDGGTLRSGRYPGIRQLPAVHSSSPDQRGENDVPATDSHIEHGAVIDDDDIALIHSADTFFLGTTHPERGNDASHRGGPAGFVHADHNTVEWPDSPGNNMFNSFGNLEIDPTAALLFIDFDSGRTLQLSGRAVVDWEKSTAHGNTGRWVRFTTESVVGSRLPPAPRAAMSPAESGGHTVEP